MASPPEASDEKGDHDHAISALDVTVVNPLKEALLNQAVAIPGHALSHEFNRKMSGTGDACRREGIVFIRLPMEALGGWHEDAVLQVKKMGSAQSRQIGQEESVAIAHIFQRLSKMSILLVRGNVALFLNRIPSFPDPQTDGIE